MVDEQLITDNYALYNGDCVEVMRDMPDRSAGLTVYSPPFGGLYCYSSDDRDLSNSADYGDFFDHYEYVVRQIERITYPGRMTAVHVADVPSGNSGGDYLRDFSGDVIRLHERLGFRFAARFTIWKEPLAVRLRTMRKDLAHQTFVEDSTDCTCASADYLLMFRKPLGTAERRPVAHPVGLTEYAGSAPMPADILPYREYAGKQTENKFSQWVWRQYASSVWMDVRLERTLPFKAARDEEDEKHVHPLQLDVIDRAVTMWSNPGEVVFTPFMGVGSEVFSATRLGRRGIGAELKPSYYRQAVKNMETVHIRPDSSQTKLFGG